MGASREADTGRKRPGMRLTLAVFVFAAALSDAQEPRSLGAADAAKGGKCDSVAVRSLTDRARQPATAAHEAARLLREAHRACPGEGGLLLEAAGLLATASDYVGSLELVERVLAESPALIEALLVKANTQLMAQRFQAAAESASSVLSHHGDHPAALKIKGNATYFLGDERAAEGIFLQLLDKYPSDSEASYMLGRIYYQEGRIEHAAAQFQRVLKLAPKSYKAYDNLGLCYQALGEAEKAVQSFLSAIKLVETAHPEYDWPYANLASLLIDQGDPDRGYDAAFTAARRNPHSARNFFLGGKALALLGRNLEALKWLQRSTELDRGDSRPWYLLSQLYSRLEDEENAKKAVAAFLEAKSNEPDDPK